MIKNYLTTPNFKIKHPANLLALLFVFLFSFAVAYPAHAQTVNDHGTYIPSNGLSGAQQAKSACNAYRAANQSGVYLSGSCSLSPTLGLYNWQYSSTPGFPYEWVNNHFKFNESATECPNGGSPDSTGLCAEVVQPDCPPQGDKVRLFTLLNGTYDENGSFIEDSSGERTIEIGGSRSAEGCGFAVYTGPDFMSQSDVECYKLSSSEMGCYQNYQSTGEALDPEENEPVSLIDENITAFTEEDGETDTRENRTQVNDPPPNEVTNEDGTKVTTDQKTTTETRGDGTLITKQEDTFFISETDGIIKNEIVTTTTYEHPDGSKTVETETRTEYTQTPITNYTIDNSSNRITINASDGSSASTTTKTTDTYDAQGNKTSSETTQTTGGDSEGEAAEEQKEDICKQDPKDPKCEDGEFKKTEKGKFLADDQQGSAMWHYNKAKEELDQLYSDIQSEMTGKLDIELSNGSTSIETNPLSWRGQQYSSGGGIANLINWFDFMNISSLVLLVFALASLYILLKD